jgi:hypothetical protein
MKVELEIEASGRMFDIIHEDGSKTKLVRVEDNELMSF